MHARVRSKAVLFSVALKSLYSRFPVGFNSVEKLFPVVCMFMSITYIGLHEKMEYTPTKREMNDTTSNNQDWT